MNVCQSRAHGGAVVVYEDDWCPCCVALAYVEDQTTFEATARTVADEVSYFLAACERLVNSLGCGTVPWNRVSEELRRLRAAIRDFRAAAP